METRYGSTSTRRRELVKTLRAHIVQKYPGVIPGTKIQPGFGFALFQCWIRVPFTELAPKDGQDLRALCVQTQVTRRKRATNPDS